MIPLSLKPVLQPVDIGCNVDDATVYIDGVDCGRVGSQIDIPQGMHHIRVSKDKYIDIERTVEIDSTITYLSFSLEENRNLREIHAIPITIFADSKKIYKNNREIKDWGGSGTSVRFMPGKYMISDDSGNKVIIRVVDEPFTVYVDYRESVIKGFLRSMLELYGIYI